MGVGDPHCHTTASDGLVTPAELVAAAQAAGLDLIGITDHDTMANAAEVAARGADVGLAVVKGMEITTAWPAQTHVLGWFLESPVASGRPLEDTVAAIHDQGGLAVIPHPFMPTYFASCQPGMLLRLLDRQPVDGLELVHTAPLGARRRAELQRFYALQRDRLGAAVGGSDSHFGEHDLGLAVTDFPGATAADFRRAINERATVARRTAKRRQVPPALLVRQQWRSLVELPLRRAGGRL